MKKILLFFILISHTHLFSTNIVDEEFRHSRNCLEAVLSSGVKFERTAQKASFSGQLTISSNTALPESSMTNGECIDCFRQFGSIAHIKIGSIITDEQLSSSQTFFKDFLLATKISETVAAMSTSRLERPECRRSRVIPRKKSPLTVYDILDMLKAIK